MNSFRKREREMVFIRAIWWGIGEKERVRRGINTFDLREDIIDIYDVVGSGRAVVVYDGGVVLYLYLVV